MGMQPADVVTALSSSSSVTVRSSQSSLKSAKSINSSPTAANLDAAQIKYRTVKSLPFELQEHCSIYLEEGLYSQALNFLISLLSAGTASATPPPALLPQPQFLRLIATLTVHPTLTTRAKSADRCQAANLAFYYLRLVLKLAGPINSGLAEAFKYAGVTGRASGRRRNTRDSPEKEHSGNIENDLANSGALFAQVESFWHIVGWAFNCSILYKRRWERWSLWMEHMIEVLEADWDLRFRADEMEQSLLVQYISSIGGQTDSGRKIIRAIFANGRKISVGEWKEVWLNETRELRKEDNTKKVEKTINIEADDYGDYHSDENEDDFEEGSSPSIASSRSQSPTKKVGQLLDPDFQNAADTFGGLLALSLRVRLLALLSKVALYYPLALTWSAQQVANGTERLYDLLLEHVRPLSLPRFFIFMAPSTLRHWDPTAVSVFTQYMLHRGSLIDGAAPEPASYVLTEESLLESHLPWAASNNTVVDNAKVSICVENLMRIYDRYGPGLTRMQDLEKLAEQGIKAREAKAKLAQSKRGRKRKGDVPVMDEGEGWTILRDSASRIRLLLQVGCTTSPAHPD